jgi:excisionase family DNA binding protein
MSGDARARADLLLLSLDDEFARHMVKAADHWIGVLRQAGMRAPASVVEFRDLCSSRVSGGQRVPEVDPSAAVLEPLSMSPLLLTYGQTEAALQCSARHVKRLVATGELPRVLCGGLSRIRAADLAEYVANLAGRGSGGDAA